MDVQDTPHSERSGSPRYFEEVSSLCGSNEINTCEMCGFQVLGCGEEPTDKRLKGENKRESHPWLK